MLPAPFASGLTSIWTGSPRSKPKSATTSSPSPPPWPRIVGPHARWFHYGLTSNDVVDTSQALLIQQASAIIAADLEKLSDVLERRAWEFKDTPMIGRTHGIHAEPITFGFKLANWYSETQRNIARFRSAAEDMRVGKFSGAVGTFAHLEP